MGNRDNIFTVWLILLCSLFCSSCFQQESDHHPDDYELAPVDWSAWNKPILTPLIEAGDYNGLKSAISENPDLVHQQAANGTGSPLFDAVNSGSTKIVDLLLENGANINESLGVRKSSSKNIPDIDMTGYTPLHLAVEKSDLEMVKHLVELGADVEKEYSGKTPYELALEYDHKEIAEFLTARHKDIGNR